MQDAKYTNAKCTIKSQMIVKIGILSRGGVEENSQVEIITRWGKIQNWKNAKEKIHVIDERLELGFWAEAGLEENSRVEIITQWCKMQNNKNAQCKMQNIKIKKQNVIANNPVEIMI